MNSILRNLSGFLLLLILGGFLNQVNATHIAGGEIHYKSLNDTDYVITMTIYRDCQGANIFNGSRQVRLFHSTTCATNPNSTFGTFYGHPFATYNLPLTNIGGTEVSQLCDDVADSSFCSNIAAQRKYPGMEKFVYEDTITIPFKCNSWYVAHYFNARNSSMNAKGPQTVNPYQDTSSAAVKNGRPFYIEAKINNDYTFAAGNSSPVFTSDPIPYFCKNIQSSFNYSVVDADGDILKYELVPGQYITNINDTSNIQFSQLSLVYRQPEYTSSKPLHDAVLNTNTGALEFKQRVRGRYIVVLKVTEYDKNNPDSIKSELVRDIQFFIDPCSGNDPPEFASGGVFDVTGGKKESATTIKTLKTSALCFNASFTDPDIGDTLTTTNNRTIALVGATETKSGINPDTTRICWTPPANPLPSYTLSFTSKDNNCPVKAATSEAIRIDIVDPINNVDITATKETCDGENDGVWTATFDDGIGPFGYYWIKDGTDTIRVDSNVLTGVSSKNSYSVVVTDSFNMTSIQSVGRNLPPTFPVRVVASSVTDIDCAGGCTGKITITSVTGGNTSSPGVSGYFYRWNTTADTTATPGSLCAGTHLVTITDDNGCDTVEQFFVSQKPLVSVDITDSSNILCKGGSDGTATSSAKTIECGVYSNLSTKCSTTSDVTIGSGTGQNGLTNYPTPFAAANSAKQQYLYLASELRAAGFKKGRVSKLSFILKSGFAQTFTDYVLSIGCTDSTNLDNGFVNGGFQVFSQNSYTIPIAQLISGEPAVVFSKEFEWDGASNIIIQICNSKSGASHLALENTTTSFNSVAYFTSDTSDACLSDTATQIVTTRPNVKFHYCDPGISYSWNSTPVQTDSAATGLPAGTYIVTASNLAGCEAKDTVTLTEPPLGLVLGSTLENAIACAGDNDGSASIQVTGGTPGFTFVWPAGVTTQVGSDSIANNLSGGVKYRVTVTDSKGCEDTLTVLLSEPNGITFGNSTVTDVGCKGASTGAIAVVLDGGTTPYSATYVWDPVATGTTALVSNLTAGTYRVTAEDANGCTNDTTFVVNEPATTITFGTSAQTNVLCKGASTGNITVNLTGGTTPYSSTYIWSPNVSTTNSATNLSAGTYNVTAEDANGCTNDTSFVITEPTDTTTFGGSSQTNVLCKGASTGVINVVPSGGALPYSGSFTWSPNVSVISSASNLSAGNYSVTATDANGCASDTTFTITEPSDSTVFGRSTQTNVLCFGESTGVINVVPTRGALPYSTTFIWSPNVSTTSSATNLSAGSYSVTAEDANGCLSDTTFVLTEPSDSVTFGNSLVTPVNCKGTSTGAITVNLSGGTTPYSTTYTWLPNVSATNSASNLAAGNYSVTATDGAGCQSDTTFTITEPTDTMTFGTSTVSNVSCKGASTGSITVNLQGGTTPYNSVYTWLPNVSTTNSATGLAAGSYAVTATDASGCQGDTTFTITEPASGVTFGGSIVTDVLCKGASTGQIIAVPGGGTPPYSNYRWSAGGSTNDTASSLAAGNYTVTVEDASSCDYDTTFTITEPADSTIFRRSTQTNVLCFGESTGVINVVPTRGALPYSTTFIWSPNVSTTSSATNLSAGSYSVTAEDANGCLSDTTFVITEPSDSVTFGNSVVTAVNCKGASTGAITVNLTGGTTPYSTAYTWLPNVSTSNSASNLVAGNYSVTATDGSGCQSDTTFTITEPTDTMTFGTSIVGNVRCKGASTGSITVNIQGGTTPYNSSYTWSPNVSTTSSAAGLAAGSYAVTATDASGCQGDTTFTITEPASGVTFGGSIVTDVLCKGASTGEIVVVPGGGTPPYSNYRWSAGGSTNDTASSLAAGNYTVTVEDASSCDYDTTFTITEPATILSASFTGKKNPTCVGTGNNGEIQATVTGGVKPYSFTWIGSGTSTGPGDSLRTGMIAGPIEVTVRDANGCEITVRDTLVSPGNIAVSFTLTEEPTCFGDSSGTVYATITGGTGPKTYSFVAKSGQLGSTDSIWTNTAADTITVNVEDSLGCKATSTVVLGQPDSMQFNFQIIQPVSCSGDSTGSIRAIVTGGTRNYTYNWNGVGFPNLVDSIRDSIPTGSFQLNITDGNGCLDSAMYTMTGPATPLAATLIGDTVLCASDTNGVAYVIPTGGALSYTYNWSAGNGGLNDDTSKFMPAGVFTVTVTDINNCFVELTDSIVAPDTIKGSFTNIVNPGCGGTGFGSLDVIPSGGTPNATSPLYSYTWIGGGLPGASDSIRTNLSSGLISVVISDANGCTSDTISQMLTPPGNINPNFTLIQNPQCFNDTNGRLISTPSGGTAPYSFVWTHGATGISDSDRVNLPSGVDIIVTISDAGGCAERDTFKFLNPSPFQIQFTDSVSILCAGGSNGSATITPITGSPAYSFAWPTGVSTQTGSDSIAIGLSGNVQYIVTVTDGNGCDSEDTIVLNDPNPLTLSFTDSIEVKCFNEPDGSITVTPSGGSGVYTYAWSASNGDPVSTSSVSDSVAIGLIGNVAYSVTVTDAVGGCSAQSTYTMDQPNDIVAIVRQRGSTTCGDDNGIIRINVFGGVRNATSPFYNVVWDSSGVVKAGTGFGNSFTINNLYSGLYTFTATDANGCFMQDTVSVNDRGAPRLIPTGGPQNGIVDATCNGVCDGEVNLTLVFAQAPVTYAWSNGDTTQDVDSLCVGQYNITVTDTNGCKAFYDFEIENDTNISINTTVSPLSCNSTVCDGSATAQGLDGIAPYKYQWSTSLTDTLDNISNLCAGKYYVGTQDSLGCVAVDTIELLTPTNFSITLSSDSTSCNGSTDGSVRVSSETGGAAPYSYQWSTGANDTLFAKTGLGAGSYVVTVFETGGCSVVDTIDVLQPDTISNSFTITDADCGLSNGAVTANPTNGKSPYNFVWPNAGATTANNDAGYAAGSYNVLISDANNCTINRSFNIGNLNGPSIVIDSIRHESCVNSCDGAIFTTVSGGNPTYIYDWSLGNGSSDDTLNACAGTYTLRVTDQKNCISFQSATIDPGTPLLPNASVVANASAKSVCDGSATAAPSGGSGRYGYNWMPGSLTTQSINSLCAGTYFLTVTDSASGCVGLDTIEVTEPNLFTIDSLDVKQPSCATSPCDGFVFVRVTGGTPPYKFRWDNGDTTQFTANRCAGLVSVTVTDVNNSNVFPFLLQNPGSPNISTAKVDVTCFGSNNGIGVGINLTGSPLNWTWPALSVNNDTATGLAAGLYEVRATDASGCIAVDTVRINEPDSISISFAATQPNCGVSDGSVTSTVTGGTPNYSLEWLDATQTPLSPSQTGLVLSNISSGIYYLKVTDNNGCEKIRQITVNDKNAPVVTLDSVRNESCLNKCDGGIFVSISGGAGGNIFSWNPGSAVTEDLTNACANTYTLEVTDASGCKATFQETIDPGKSLNTNVTKISDASATGVCDGSARVTVSGGVSPLVYSWTSAETIDIATALCAGMNYVTVTDNNGCQAIDSVEIFEPVTIILTQVDTTAPKCGQCDGKIKIVAAGGLAPYTYNWDNGDTADSTINRCAGVKNVTVTDANLVSRVFQIGLSSQNAPSLAVTETDLDCFSQCNGTAMVKATGGTAPYNVLWPSIGSTDTLITSLCKGIYLVEVRDSKGCISVDSANIEEPNEILVNITTDSADCGLSNGRASLTAIGGSGALSFSWSTGATGVTAITGLVAGSYDVTVADANACNKVVSFSINNPAGPTVIVDTVIDETCVNSCNGSIFITPSGTAGPYTFDWSPGSLSGEDVSNLCAGVYSVRVSDAAGCVTVISDTVGSPTSIGTSISLISNASNYGRCDGMAAISNSIPGVYKYAWSSGDAGDTARMLCAGVNYVTITTASGCQYIDSVVVNQPQKLIIINQESTQPQCNICDGKVEITVTGGVPPYNYNWDNGDKADSTVNRCAGILFVTVTDSKGYAEIFSLGLNNSLAPRVGITSNDSKCFDGCSGTASATATGTLAPYKFSWPTLGKNTANVSNLCAGTYIVEVSDNVGCKATQTVVIGEPSEIDVDVSKQLPNCNSANGLLLAQANGGTPNTGGYSYTWLDQLGLPIVPAQTTNRLLNAAAGLYHVVVTDDIGCKDTTAITLDNVGGKIAIGLDSIRHVSCASECDGAIFTSLAGSSPGTYEWVPGGQNTRVITAICAGTYTAIVTDTAQCKTLQSFTVNGPESLNVVFSGVQDATCENSNDGSIKALVLTTQNFDVSWTGPKEYFSNRLTAENLLAGTYTINVTDENNCVATDSVSIDTTFKFTVDAGSDLTLCQGSRPQLLEAAVRTSDLYTTFWYNESGEIIGKQDTISISPVPGSKSYIAEVRQDVCIKSDTIVVTQSDSLFAEAGPDRTISSGQSVELGGSPSAPEGVSVLWSPAEDLSAGSVRNPVSSVTETTTYYLTVGDIENCVVSDSMVVNITDRIVVNDGFSPNGDGVNDVWDIAVLKDFPNAKVTIFNRWGQTLYSSDPYVPWDGTFEGEPVSIGTYYYIIDLKDSSVSESVISGPVTIIR